MTDDDLKRFIGSDLQQAMVGNVRHRLAEFFTQFLTAQPTDLLQIQAQAVAYYRILREISLDAEDLARLSQESVDQMENMRRQQEKGLEDLLRQRTAQASRGL